MGANGADEKGAKVATTSWAEDVERPPPQPLPKGPRDAAHAHGRAVGLDVLNRLLLVIADEGVEILERAGFRLRDMDLENDTLIRKLTIDVERGNIDGVLVKLRPGEFQIRRSQRR